MKKKKPTPEINENGQTEKQLETNAGAESTQSGDDSGNAGNDEIDSKSFAEHAAEIESEKTEINNSPAPEKVEEKAFDLDAIMKEYAAPAEGKRTRKPRKSKEPQPEAARVQMIIPGRLFVTVCDNAAISAIGAVDSWISKNPVNTDLLKLNEQQIADLAPLAEEAIKAMKLENDPISVYFGSLAAIYISNYLQLRAYLNKQSKNGN